MRRLALIALALGLASCSGAPRGGERLRVWAMGREGEVVQELARDFERENPGVTVVVQQMPWSAAHEKLLTSYVGRSTPDVAQLGNTWISEFSALEALEPLDAWIARSRDVRRDGFFPGIWDTNVLEGVTYGVPWYVDTRVLFYRRDVLRRAGYDSIPPTWREWRAAMVAVKRVVGPDRFAIFLPANEWNVPVILGLQAGSPLLGHHDTRGAFSDSAFRGAFDFFIGLYRDKLAPPLSNSEIANFYQEFERGYFNMYVTGPWNLGEFRRRLPADLQDDWETAPLPGPSGAASGLSTAGGSSLVVFRASRHKRAAWRLVEFLSRPEQQARFYHLCGDLPARREAWADSSLAGDPHLRAFRVQLERTVSTPKVPEWESIAIRVQDVAERAARGAATPEAALAALDRDVDRMLEKRRWLIERESGAAPAGARR